MSSDADTATVTEVMTVYMALDGGLHHTRCNQRLSLHGQRAGDFGWAVVLTCRQEKSNRQRRRSPVGRAILDDTRS